MRYNDVSDMKDITRSVWGKKITNTIQSGMYIKFCEDPIKQPLINSFNRYLRSRGKVVIDMDQIAYSDSYKIFFYKCYMVELFQNPHKFVSYTPGTGWTTDTGELYTFQIRGEKWFPTYYYLLFNKVTALDCKFCQLRDLTQITEIVVICMYCCCSICEDCFVERRDWYFTGNNQFRCINCRELNFWD